MKRSFWWESTCIEGDSSHEKVRSDEGSGNHDDLSLDQECSIEADKSASSDNSPVQVSVTDDESGGENESKSNSSPSGEDGNSDLLELRNLESDESTNKEAYSKNNPKHPLLGLAIVFSESIEG